MKYKFSLALIFVVFTYFSCEKCELLEQTIDDPNPMFDCADLMANIGDPCDDNNPDTTDDTINGNCECIGGGTEFDCPDLMLNIGDACTDNNETTINDAVSAACECIGESVFDCPVLGLNIGDSCDDGNPDTENDAVDANCNCIGEIINDCAGVLYASRVTIENNSPTGWFFDSAVKTLGMDFSFSNIEEKVNGSLDPTAPFFSNFAAFDRINNQYAFAYQFDVGTPNPLYLAETNVFSSTFLEEEEYYAAPVFSNGELYAINVFYDAPAAQYTIVRIDQNTGATTDVFSDNITVNSPMLKVAISSATDNSGNIYFISATNLIVYNPTGNFATYVDIDDTFDADNQVVYFGLEYKADEEVLLAMKNKSNSPSEFTDLVSISTDGNYQVNTVFDIKDNLGLENDQEISFNFHSTTFAQCDNTYYITEIKDLEAGMTESFLIEINLDNNTLEETVYPDYLFGIEIFEN